MRRDARLAASITAVTLLLPLSSAFAQRSAEAQATSPVARMLLTAPDPRTRAQAALTLGRLRPPDARGALETALGDRVAVVRAAAASTLGELGDGAAVAALEGRRGDPDVNVRGAIERALGRLGAAAAGGATAAPTPAPVDLNRARFVVAPGDLQDHTRANGHHLDTVSRAIVAALTGREGLAVLPSLPLPSAAVARVRRGLLRAYALDGGLARVERRDGGEGQSVRAEVNFAIVALPQRAIVGMISGAATARGTALTEASQRHLEGVAVEGAVRGALRDFEQNLPRALH